MCHRILSRFPFWGWSHQRLLKFQEAFSNLDEIVGGRGEMTISKDDQVMIIKTRDWQTYKAKGWEKKEEVGNESLELPATGAITSNSTGQEVEGEELNEFRPSGALEIRQAGYEFDKMRKRISVHLNQRSEMLSGISHDLRTPLTRLKLQIEMLNEKEMSEKMSKDIDEMEKMLNDYLQFAKTQVQENSVTININEFFEFGIVSELSVFKFQHSDPSSIEKHLNIFFKSITKNLSRRSSILTCCLDASCSLIGKSQALLRPIINPGLSWFNVTDVWL